MRYYQAMTETITPTSEESVRSAFFNQGCPLSAGAVHSKIHQGRHGMWPPVEATRIILDAMEARGRVKRVGSDRWGWSYWLVPLEGFGR